MAKNCDILPISRFYHPEMPEIPRNQAENQPPGRRSVWRSCGVCCVARQAVNFRRFRRWRYPYKGKQKNGSTGLVARSERVRYPECIPAGIRARCGALWGCLRRRNPRGGSVGRRLPGIASGHKKSPERVRAGVLFVFLRKFHYNGNRKVKYDADNCYSDHAPTFL